MGGGIFVGNIDLRCTSMMMIFMLVFAMTWEYLTDLMEYRCEHNRAYKEMLTKVYKELMILGFIAFAVILGKEFGLAMSPEKLHCFEFCDLLVSICVLFYVGQACISSFCMHVIRRKWDRIAMKSVHRVVAELEEKLEVYKNSCCHKFLYFIPYTSAYTMRDEADFKIIQMVFKTQFHLDPQFDYVMYAKSVLMDNVVDIANIQVSHWVAICVFCVFMYLGTDAIDGDENQDWCIWCGNTEEDNERAVLERAGAGRRQLGGAVVAEKCELLPCGMNNTALADAINVLLGNGTHNYDYECAKAACISPPVKPPVGNDQIALSIFLFILTGVGLAFIQWFINRSLDGRIQKVLKFSGAASKWAVSDLLRSMDEELKARGTGEADDDDDAEGAGTDGGDDDNAIVIEDDDEDEGQQGRVSRAESHMIHFKEEGRSAHDVLSIGVYSFFMWTTKFVQLMNCFYLGFYFCHMAFLVNDVDWGFLSFLSSAGQGISIVLVHFLCLLPASLIVSVILPVTIRKVSLLSGVLFLNDTAVDEVLAHIEKMENIRERITERLLRSSFRKGKPKLEKGRKMLQLLQTGEISMLKELSNMDPVARMTRAEINAILDRQDTETTDDALENFMNRAEYAEFLKESPEDQATAQTSKTLQLGEGDKLTDSIEVGEFITFLLRAIAHTANVASENGVPNQEVGKIEKACVDLECIAEEDFASARKLARTRGMFRTVDKDNSDTIDRSELWRAIRKYRVPITREDLETIMRVLDPDQSGQVNMQEWVDFMLSSSDNFERRAHVAQDKIRANNAERNILSDVISTVDNLKDDLVSGVVGGVTDKFDFVTDVGGNALKAVGADRLISGDGSVRTA